MMNSKKSDLHQKLGRAQFKLPKSAKLLSVEIAEKSPSDLPVNVSYSDNSVKLEPLLLNEKDSVTIKVLVSKPQEEVIFSGRIAGVKKIEERVDRNHLITEISYLTRVISLLIVISLMIMFIYVGLNYTISN